MLIYLRNRRAQIMIGEYAIVIFLVFAVMTAVTVYFKRAVQARIRDARSHMVSQVRSRTAGQFDGEIRASYEPYYTKTSATVGRSSNQIRKVLPGLSSGIFKRDSDEATGVDSRSTVAPPRDAN